MKTFATSSLLGVAGVLACCSSCASAFVIPSAAVHTHVTAAPTSVPSPLISRDTCRRTSVALSAEKADGKEEEQEPMDLDLEQMFEVRSFVGTQSSVLVLLFGHSRGSSGCCL